ncbi:MAG TPA: IPT/TIG domain-containing protein [Kofleriaceae bacterium]|nr:IPT/TIG domain-containing protein [Kofleriaceae bacterium]
MPQPDSDDRFVMGELVLIEGDDFGQLPAVRIGGQAARVLARTGAGGIVCRIPTGIDSGTIEIVVSHEGGRDSSSVGVERYAALLDRNGGQVYFVALGGGSEGEVRARLSIPGAIDVRIAPDGRAAYVVANPAAADQTASIRVISLTSGGGPKEVRALHLDLAQVTAFGVAERAPIGAVVGRGQLVLLDLDSSLRPQTMAPFPLIADATAMAVNAEGKQIALLSADDNVLTTVNVSQREAPRMDGTIDLLPGEREPAAVDLEYAPGGGELWVLLGDRPAAPAAEPRPTRLALVGWETGRARIERTVEIKNATGLPVGLAIGRRARSAVRQAPMLISTVHRKLFANDPSFVPSKLDDLGQLIGIDPEGHSKALSSQTAVFGDPEVSQDLAWAISPTIRLVRGGGGTAFDLGLSFEPLPGGRGKYRFIKLGEGKPSDLKRPPVFAIAP